MKEAGGAGGAAMKEGDVVMTTQPTHESIYGQLEAGRIFEVKGKCYKAERVHLGDSGFSWTYCVRRDRLEVLEVA